MRWLLALPILLLAVCLPRLAGGQAIEVPSFEIARPLIEPRVGVADVAVGSDGNLLVLYTEWKFGSPNATKALTRLVTPDGTPLGDPIRVDTAGHVRSLNVVPDGEDGYVAAWEVSEDRYYLHGRRLDAAGAGLGAEFPVDDPDAFGYALPTSVAAMANGSAFFWKRNNQILGRLYDLTGIPRGTAFPISDVDGASGFELDADTMPDGGFVVAWQSSFGTDKTSARVYRADGQPRGPVLPVDAVVLADLRVAASPTGGFAVVGGRWDGVDTIELWVRRFSDDGVLLWETLVDQPPADVFEHADLAFDSLGNLYVAWGSFGGPISYPPRARGLDAGGVPVGGAIEIADFDTPSEVRVARLPNGTSFATVWNRFGSSIRGAVVALCGPGSSVCGDGSVDAHCEQCDHGPANDDDVPNACRTNCRRAHCGDGTLDSAEQCDDGNVLACDGCSPLCAIETGHVCGDGELDPTCNEECDDGVDNGDVADACRTTCRLPRCADGIVDGNEECDDGGFAGCDGCSASCRIETGLVCGDGIAEAGCNESCDDANQTSADGCSAECIAERIPGGGKPATDCYAEWSVRNVGNVPYLDKQGAISGQQACTDDDPSCDLDGGVPGSCTFSVRVCGNNTDLPACTAPLRLRSWELRSPSIAKAAHDPTAAAVRDAFGATVPSAIVGPSTRDVCADQAGVHGSPARQAGRLQARKAQAEDPGQRLRRHARHRHADAHLPAVTPAALGLRVRSRSATRAFRMPSSMPMRGDQPSSRSAFAFEKCHWSPKAFTSTERRGGAVRAPTRRQAPSSRCATPNASPYGR